MFDLDKTNILGPNYTLVFLQSYVNFSNFKWSVNNNNINNSNNNNNNNDNNNDIFKTSLKATFLKSDTSQEFTRNPIFIRGKSRTPTKIWDGTTYDNTDVNNI